MGNAHKKAFPYEGKAARRSRDGRGRCKFDTTSQSAFGCQLPCKGSLGACKFIKPPRKKVQSDKLRLHLLFAANIQRQ